MNFLIRCHCVLYMYLWILAIVVNGPDSGNVRLHQLFQTTGHINGSATDQSRLAHSRVADYHALDHMHILPWLHWRNMCGDSYACNKQITLFSRNTHRYYT